MLTFSADWCSRVEADLGETNGRMDWLETLRMATDSFWIIGPSVQH